MKRFDTFGAYMFDLLPPLETRKRAANQFFIFFKVIGLTSICAKKDAFPAFGMSSRASQPGWRFRYTDRSGHAECLRARHKTIGPAYP